MASSSIFLDIIKSIGIATRDDIDRLQGQLDEMNYKFQKQIDDLRGHHDKLSISFSNHKKKTDEELNGFVVDVSQIIVALDFLQKSAQAESQFREIRRMITALKTKRTKARTAIYSISLAKSEGQIDIALAEAANG